MPAPSALHVRDEVAAALSSGGPVVALESTIVSHGLPRPDNLRVARAVEAAVREHGAVPATVAVVEGRVCVGLADAQLEGIAGRDDVVKVSARDVAVLAARGGWGATTVAATARLACAAGIEVFATGGLGGVHREAASTWDESADLPTLARTGITIVCAGVKSILDVGATLERLETLGVTVAGYRTDRFPGFYLADSGHPAGWQLDGPHEVAAVMAARRGLGLDRSALVVAQPLPADEAMDPSRHDAALQSALEAAATAGVRGSDVTPFLLEHFRTSTSGESLRINERIILRNATLAAQIAVAAAGAR
jgi:pseudouridine-5'-phosphate glycosidase